MDARVVYRQWINKIKINTAAGFIEIKRKENEIKKKIVATLLLSL